MEKVFFIKNSNELKSWKPKFTRIYFGAEFCERRIPSVKETEKVINFCGKNGIDVSLVTPFVTDAGLESLKKVFNFIAQQTKFEEFEVIVNDWGVLYFLTHQYPQFKLCLGRLLNKQKRDPRIKSVYSKWPDVVKEYFSLALGESIFKTKIMRNSNLIRIELDNLLQGIKRGYPEIAASIYYPFVYITTSRYCLTGIGFNEKKFKRVVSFKCERECENNVFSFTSKDMPDKIHLKGNTQFVKNEKLPNETELKSLNINRVVYKKEID